MNITNEIKLNHDITSSKTMIIKTIIISLSVLLLSMGKIFGSLSGLGFAAIVALPFNYSILGLIASIIGYAIGGYNITNITYTAAAIIIITIKYIAKMMKFKLHQPIMLSFLTFCTLVTISIINFFYFDQPLTLLMMNMMQSVFSMTVTFYSYSFYKVLISGKSIDKYVKFEWYSTVIVFALLVCVSASINFYDINIGFILSTTFILIAGIKFGCTGSGIAGIIMLIALTLQSITSIELAAVLIIAGFICGIFNEFGRLAVMSVFVLCYTVIFLMYSTSLIGIISATSVFLGVGLTFFIPKVFLDKIIIPNSTMANNNSNTKLFKTNLSSKLIFASATITDLKRSINFVSSKMQHSTKLNIDEMILNIENAVCINCSKKLNCHDNNYDTTNKNMREMIQSIKLNGELTTNNLSQYLNDNCIKKNNLVSATNKFYTIFLEKSSQKSNNYNQRMMVSEQLSCITDLLNEVTEELQDLANLDNDLTKKVESTLNVCNIPINQTSCYIDKTGKINIEFYAYDTHDIDYNKLTAILEDITDKKLDNPVIITINPYTKISYFEKSNTTISLGIKQLNFKNNNICGDSYVSFTDCKGNHFIMLSDGMGKGRRAALDSVMTCSILQELIKAGFGYESSLKLLNSALSVKSTDESIATIDIVKINPYTNTAEFIKAGAASSYIYSKGLIKKIQAFTLPIGILQGIEYDKKVFNLEDDDIIIMVSDGVDCVREESIKHIIDTNFDLTSDKIADILCNLARSKVTNDEDDITVMVTKMSNK